VSDVCPHCGSTDYGPLSTAALVCMRCGYDTEHGAEWVCPGGMHPRDGQVCCDACWDRAPRNLPDAPRWRSRRRSLQARRRRSCFAWAEIEAIDTALIKWLQEHPA
jgi:hypothetical protein